jgi:hypothetical protein
MVSSKPTKQFWYIAYGKVGRKQTIFGYGKSPLAAVGQAKRRGAKQPLDTALAAKALCDAFAERGDVRFSIAVNGRANLA